MRDSLNRLIVRRFDYTTRIHMKRRLQRIDFKFVAAMIATAAGVAFAVKYL